ncbi:MAG: bifunctional nicotinamidase/pyrazinamidase [Saprospirales bacterium]|nr:bifunctional nicotinamidase/pyrazinamidase [Saprospirales bacterium]MBK8490194.1 bifunctional nicotinamidase/pyrazinamidase [Saprospirales bacterium]
MKALLLIDLQNDYLPGGMVEVPEGDQVIPVANRLMEVFDLVIAVRDWHPANHQCFAANHLWRRPGQLIKLGEVDQLLWPMHCVQHSFGAELAIALRNEKIHRHFFKGTDPEVDSYSCFFDNARKNDTGLATFLHEKGVEELYLLGLPLEFGVRYTAIDALALGFRTWVIEDGCKAQNAEPGDGERIWKELREQGANLLQSAELVPLSG